eukprot:893464-Rhodomonas_salina.1
MLPHQHHRRPSPVSSHHHRYHRHHAPHPTTLPPSQTSSHAQHILARSLARDFAEVVAEVREHVEQVVLDKPQLAGSVDGGADTGAGRSVRARKRLGHRGVPAFKFKFKLQHTQAR